MDLPPEQAAKILRALAGSGLLETRQGRGGGYRLARSLSQITVADVARALGAENNRNGARMWNCPVDPGRVCSVYERLRDLQMSFWELMGNATLESFIGTSAESAPEACLSLSLRKAKAFDDPMRT